MTEPIQTISLALTPEEQEAVDALQQEMGLAGPSEVIHVLLRQAQQRVSVVCPTCGHSARKTAEDVASCTSCMSVLELSDGIWQVISLQ